MLERFNNSTPTISSVENFPSWKRFLFGVTRRGLFFFFSYLPYGKIVRINKPDLKLPFIWASSHHNFLCDIVPGAYEGEVSAKFLAKHTLFFFPLGFLLRFFGAIPLYRMQDQAGKGGTEANRQSFRAAIEAMKHGWPVAIFPEGVSIISPGLVLPFKPGIGKLAIGAELESNFELNLRINPVALEYGERRRVGSGIYIRYGKPIVLRDFEATARKNERQAVNQVMEVLTAEMIKIFPHFKSKEDDVLAHRLVRCSVIPHRLELAQIFLNANDSAGALEFKSAAKALLEKCERTGFSLEFLGSIRKWEFCSDEVKGKDLRVGICFGPFYLMNFVNSFIAEKIYTVVVEKVATDETEMMTLRIALSPFLVLPIYFGQFFVFSFFMKLNLSIGFGYVGVSVILWWLCQRMRQKMNVITSLIKRKCQNREIKLNECLSELESLRQNLNHLQNRSGD